MDKDYNFSQKTLEIFKDPEVLRAYRVAIMDRRIENFKRAIANSDVQKKAQELFKKSMIERLGDTEKGRRAAELLLPSFPVGCRRQTPGPGFLEAITQDNVEMRWDDVQTVTEKGIITRSGDLKEYDVIVCATGFDTSFKPSFPVVGRNGVNLAEKWTSGLPKAYFGFLVPDMPNYFTFIGPNSPISNGSLVLGVQATAMYVYKWLEKLQTESIKSFEVRHDANEEYNQHIQKYLERTVWTRGCRSWYKRGTVDGPVVAIYGGKCCSERGCSLDRGMLKPQQEQVFILWKLSKTLDGKTFTLTDCMRRKRTGLPISATALPCAKLSRRV